VTDDTPTVDLGPFLRGEGLGVLPWGATRARILEFLGRPDDVSLKKKPEVLKYGSFQLALYHRTGLHAVSVYFDEDGVGQFADRIVLVPRLSSSTSLDSFTALCSQMQLRVVERPDEAWETFRSLHIGPGATAVFNSGQLHAIHVHATRELLCGAFD
jgi:hypothetical protein